MLVVGFQSAEWHFLSLCWGKWSVSALALSGMQSNYHWHIPPYHHHPLQFSQIIQQTCDSSFRVTGLSSFGLRSLTDCMKLLEHGEMTKQSKVVHYGGVGVGGGHKIYLTFYVYYYGSERQQFNIIQSLLSNLGDVYCTHFILCSTAGWSRGVNTLLIVTYAASG